MIRYQKYQSNSPFEGTNGKWFIRIKNGEQVDVDKLAEHMAEHNTPYSQGTIRGILCDAVSCIKELLLDGKTVKLQDLAIFSLGIHCKPSNTALEATPDKIRSYSFNARGTGKCSISAI